MLPKCVEKAYQEEMGRYLDGFASEENWDAERKAAREGISNLIGCRSSDVALLSNTVEGVGLIVNEYPWDNEKEIVFYLGEHMSNKLPWIVGAKKNKFKIKPIECEKSLSTDVVLESLSDDTQALALSYVQFSDGARVDIKRIGKECRRRGILFIVDGIQAIGRLHIDVESMYIDYLICGAHKGLLVRNGIGFVYCRKNVLDKLYPCVASCMSVESYMAAECYTHMNNSDLFNDIIWYDDARRLENGNRCHQGVYALIASTRFLNSIGTTEIENQIIYLHNLLMNKLGEKSKKILPSCGSPSGIIRVNFNSEKRSAVKELLERNDIYSTVRDNNVRFCINFFNTEEQINKLADVIMEILRLGDKY